mgnify:CR=1 FL=1
MTRVKICGITNIDDAMAAVEAGADALGFVFAESPRKVDVDTAANIVAELPPLITVVGVFAGQTAEEVISAMGAGLHVAQIHGTLSVALPSHRLVRALRVASEADIDRAAGDPAVKACAAVLLDAHVEGLMGGTGMTFDWDLAVRARSLERPIVLAGGLNPENVREAISRVRPYAVDVSTGVEASPGRKDHAKIKEFVLNAKECD